MSTSFPNAPLSLCVRQSTGRATRATASSARHVIIAAAAGTATNRTASSADDVSSASNVSEVLLTTCTLLTCRWPDHRGLRRHISLFVADHLDESGCTENYHCELNAFCISNHCSCVSGFRPTPGGHCVKYHGACVLCASLLINIAYDVIIFKFQGKGEQFPQVAPCLPRV